MGVGIKRLQREPRVPLWKAVLLHPFCAFVSPGELLKLATPPLHLKLVQVERRVAMNELRITHVGLCMSFCISRQV